MLRGDRATLRRNSALADPPLLNVVVHLAALPLLAV
jgi:hypothetical protein